VSTGTLPFTMILLNFIILLYFSNKLGLQKYRLIMWMW
jgi:hypothetical protein